MPESPGADLLRLLAHRGALLNRIAEGVHDRRDLVDELGVSRSTVNRGIRDLEDAGLVEEGSDGFSVTRYGRLALEVYRTGEGLETVEPLLERLPADVPLGTIRNAAVVMAEPPLPQRPIDDIVAMMDGAAEAVALAPAVLPALVEATIERVERDDLDATVVVDETVLGGLLSERPDAVSAGAATDGYTLLRTERVVTFGLLVVDDRVASIGVHDDTGRLLGLLINEDRETVEWARETFEAYREDAEPVRAADVDH